MNILIPDSWLREYLATDATPKDIQKCLSLCGPSVERIHKINKDVVYDAEITTNRVDCMSVYGLAREACAILPQFKFKTSLKPLRTTILKKGLIPGLTVQNDFKLCKRILAIKIENIKVESSPRWLQDRLIAVGQRPLNNLVDITNYVMWETGHPAHVFDFDKITTGKMLVRQAKKGEKITTLDNKNYTLVGEEVIIDDGTGKIIDLPSVMGTSNSSVVNDTQTALLFVDDVISSRVRFASMTHAIRTQAATLLEKDVDPELGSVTMSRMTNIIKSVYSQAKVGDLLDIYSPPPSSEPISLSLSQISNLIGTEISPSQIVSILQNLSFGVKQKDSIFTVTPPTWRSSDIKIPEDVIEEIARIYGYHNITPVLMTGALPSPDYNKTFYWENRIKTALKYLGFTEIYTYSLVADSTELKLKNPLSQDWQYLRTQLRSSHQEVLDQNKGKVQNLNLFEIANVYLPKNGDLPEEQSRLIISSASLDYSHLKGIIESLLADLGINNFNINIVAESDYLYWETNMSEVIKYATDNKTYRPISKYTPIVEDINFLSKENYSALINKIQSVSDLISNIELIDKYQDRLTLRLTFHSDSKQLSSEDIAPIRKKLSDSFN